MIDQKRIMITGGTGSFGKTVIRKILKEYNPEQIIVFSRDEKKQYEMMNDFDDLRLNFKIGDVRDRDKVFKSMKGVDLVFHAAALKQVPSCEFFPMEAVKTNILGTNHILDAAEHENVEKVVVLSTDKAVNPINVMGMTKGLLEKLMLSKARSTGNRTIFCGVRYGNVMYSRGSVLPLFVKKIKENRPLTVTDENMTRFLLPLPTAIDLVLHALSSSKNGDIFIRKSPAANMGDIAKAMLLVFNSSLPIKKIGIRRGEKLHETLVTQDELIRAEDSEKFLCVKNHEDLDYDKYYSKGKKEDFPKEGYTSENTNQLNLDETKQLIESLPEIQNFLK